MSWMDWGSRPKKNAATPPPLYLTQGVEQTRYCHTCGRVIGSRKKSTSSTQVKYCSDKCKRHKPGPVDRQIEAVFVALLESAELPSVISIASGIAAQADANAEAVAKGIRYKPNDAIGLNDPNASSDAPGDMPKAQQQQANHPNGSNISNEQKAKAKDDEKPPPPRTSQKGAPKPKKGFKNRQKGDPRVLVPCSKVQELAFDMWDKTDTSDKTFGRKKNRARRGVPDAEVWKSVDMESSSSSTASSSDEENGNNNDDDDDEGDEYHLSDQDGRSGDKKSKTKAIQLEHIDEDEDGGIPLPPSSPRKQKKSKPIRPPQSESLVNGSIGGEKGWAERREIPETPEDVAKRRLGQRKAEQKEMVKCAARRAVVFGLPLDGYGWKAAAVSAASASRNGRGVQNEEEETRFCEAVMNGAVVEPSYAKGDWGIRWREE